MNYSEILCITKTYNEQDFEDFVNHYKALGFNRINIINNDSEINLKKYKSRYVRIFDIPGKLCQNTIYNKYFREIGKDCKWLFVVDDDEFLYLGEHKRNINELLTNYEQYDGLTVNWTMINYNQCIDDRPTPSCLDYCVYIDDPIQSGNNHVKTIINMEQSNDMVYWDPHLPRVGRTTGNFVNYDKIKITKPYGDTRSNGITLYHYWVKSRKDWQKKVDRGVVSNPGTFRTQTYEEVNFGYGVLDLNIKNFKEKYHV